MVDVTGLGPAMASFPHLARLDQSGFYEFLKVTGCGDLGSSPWATVVFLHFSNQMEYMNVGSALVALVSFQSTIQSQTIQQYGGYTKERFKSEFLTADTFVKNVKSMERRHNMMLELERKGVELRLGSTGSEAWHVLHERIERNIEVLCDSQETWTRYCEYTDAEEIFDRYDVDGNGHMSQDEVVMFMAASDAFRAAFARHCKGKPPTLSIPSFTRAVNELGFGQIPAGAPAYLFDRFKRSQQTNDIVDLFSHVIDESQGTIDLFEFTAGCARMLRPIKLRERASRIAGWPGWRCMRADHGLGRDATLADMVDRLSSLQTGDMLVMSLLDPSGRYFNFLENTLWTHVGIVLRHDSLPRRNGVPNQETEELLSRAKNRWRNHRFCTPRYCRCFSSASALEGMHQGAVVELLEATGQGVHVYDLATRMFLGFNAGRTGTLAVRRLRRAPDRANGRKVEAFVKLVRGHLYGVSADDGYDSFVCSKLASKFMQHMGWLRSSSAPRGYTPTDFAEARLPLEESAEWGELELIRNQWAGAPLPMSPSEKWDKAKGASRAVPARL